MSSIIKRVKETTVLNLAKQIRKSPQGLVGTAIVSSIIFVAIAAPLLSSDPLRQDISNRLSYSTSNHLLGTDYLGRDILSRVLWGARIDLTIALSVVAIAAPLGSIIGVLAGFHRRLDEFLMRITDVFLSFPDVILAMTIAVLLGREINSVIIALSFTFWSPYARLARAETLKVKTELYIEAAKAVGVGETQVLVRHIFPMVLPVVLIHAMSQIGQAILSVATLGFLGLGAQPPSPEWGLMVSEGLRFLTRAWWIATFPGLAILVTSLGFNLVGDSLRDILDIRYWQRK